MYAAYLQGGPLVAELDTQSGDDITAFKAKVDSLAHVCGRRPLRDE